CWCWASSFSTGLTGTQQLRGAFSDTEDFLDHGLVSANRCSSRTSSITSWTENIKPSFTKKLKFQSVLEGDPVELRCKMVAFPSPDILWFHNNRSLPKDHRCRICTDSTIINFDVFAEPAKDDKIEFKGKSSDMCSFQFQVTEIPPKCVIPLTNVTAALGTPVILQCLVTGKPNPTAEWYKDGDHVTDSRCIIQEKTPGHFNLLITNVTQSDAGEYKCIIQNTSGCTETTALLKVSCCTCRLSQIRIFFHLRGASSVRNQHQSKQEPGRVPLCCALLARMSRGR
uniref:Ig-like domain-containing protein n=1 Tax=Monopterus albus TaxID=43700 RepID=A0A3Q3JJ42_MONAL